MKFYEDWYCPHVLRTKPQGLEDPELPSLRASPISPSIVSQCSTCKRQTAMQLSAYHRLNDDMNKKDTHTYIFFSLFHKYIYNYIGEWQWSYYCKLNMFPACAIKYNQLKCMRQSTKRSLGWEQSCYNDCFSNITITLHTRRDHWNMVTPVIYQRILAFIE